MRTAAPSTGRPSSVRGFMTKYFESLIAAEPKFLPAGLSSTTRQLLTEPFAATRQSRVAAPETPSLSACFG